jgi:hypothetical protein
MLCLAFRETVALLRSSSGWRSIYRDRGFVLAQKRHSAIIFSEGSFAKEMVKTMKSLAILALSLATAMSAIPPAGAFPIVPIVKSQATDVQRVTDHCKFPNCFRDGRRFRDHRGSYHRYDRDRRYRYGYRDRYDRRYHRRDRDSDVGALIGGLAAGAIIGGLLAQPRYPAQPRYYAGGSAHTRWCYARYRSYRPYDNTFQPYYGPRRPCISPYL